MSAITFTQTVTSSGQIAVALFSSDLPANGFAFSFAFNYSSTNAQFDAVSYSGASSVSTSSSAVGSAGSVTISGTLMPASGVPFATILFDATGTGTLDVDITSLKIAGALASFADPVPYAFTIHDAVVELASGGSASGVYQPLDSFFGLEYKVESAPQHGTVTFGDASQPSTWTYHAAAGYYGVDTFKLEVNDVFDTKEKSVSVNISPIGTTGNDTFHSSAGNYHTDGGAGIDTLTYQGKIANFTVARSGDNTVVTDKTLAEGTNNLAHFERLAFSDGAIALDIDGDAGQAYRLYQAAFNRTPDGAGLGYWISALDKGSSLVGVAEGFINSNEFKSVYGAAPSSSELITKFYENILHREPEKAGFDYWVNILDSHSASVATVLADMSESAENQAGVAEIIGNGITFTPYVG